jgi:DNA-binding transcriptional LysR family regulator
MNWDDLRYFLAVARAGSLSAAGRDLGVSQPTVSRRLAAMEARLSVRLFDRIENRYVLTPAGDEIFDTVQHVEETVAGIDRRVAGKDLSVKGELRLTCTEVLANLYLAPHLSEFVRLHPDINLSVVCTFQHLSLNSREADVAIRVASKPPDTLVGRRLLQVAMGIYAGNNTVRTGDSPNIEDIDWIGWQDETYNRMFIQSHYPNACIRHRVDDMQAMCAMVRCGLGSAILPCYVGDSDPELRRIVREPITKGSMDLWVLSHPDVRKAARVRAFTAFIADTLLDDRDLFEGRRPQLRKSVTATT